jgi:hypothetical protein
MRQTQSNQ